MENTVSMKPSLTANQIIFYTVEDYYTSYIIMMQNTTNTSCPIMSQVWWWQSCSFKLVVRVATVKSENSALYTLDSRKHWGERRTFELSKDGCSHIAASVYFDASSQCQSSALLTTTHCAAPPGGDNTLLGTIPIEQGLGCWYLRYSIVSVSKWVLVSHHKR